MPMVTTGRDNFTDKHTFLYVSDPSLSTKMNMFEHYHQTNNSNFDRNPKARKQQPKICQTTKKNKIKIKKIKIKI